MLEDALQKGISPTAITWHILTRAVFNDEQRVSMVHDDDSYKMPWLSIMRL